MLFRIIAVFVLSVFSTHLLAYDADEFVPVFGSMELRGDKLTVSYTLTQENINDLQPDATSEPGKTFLHEKGLAFRVTLINPGSYTISNPRMISNDIAQAINRSYLGLGEATSMDSWTYQLYCKAGCVYNGPYVEYTFLEQKYREPIAFPYLTKALDFITETSDGNQFTILLKNVSFMRPGNYHFTVDVGGDVPEGVGIALGIKRYEDEDSLVTNYFFETTRQKANIEFLTLFGGYGIKALQMRAIYLREARNRADKMTREFLSWFVPGAEDAVYATVESISDQDTNEYKEEVGEEFLVSHIFVNDNGWGKLCWNGDVVRLGDLECIYQYVDDINEENLGYWPEDNTLAWQPASACHSASRLYKKVGIGGDNLPVYQRLRVYGDDLYQTCLDYDIPLSCSLP